MPQSTTTEQSNIASHVPGSVFNHPTHNDADLGAVEMYMSSEPAEVHIGDDQTCLQGIPVSDGTDSDDLIYKESSPNADDLDGIYAFADRSAFQGQTDSAFLASPTVRIATANMKRAAVVHERRHNPNILAKAFGHIVPYGSILSSSFNLCSSALGSGIIALPSAFNASGVGLCTIYLIAVGCLTMYSLSRLGLIAKRTGVHNYAGNTETLLGRYAGYLLAVLMFIMNLGGEIAYVIAMGGIAKAFMNNSPSTPAFLLTTTGRRLLTAAMWLVGMLPLCLPKEINSLRYVSVLAVLMVVFFVIMMIIRSAQSLHETHSVPGGIKWFQTGNTAIEGLSTFLFVFLCHINLYEVYDEMYKPTIRRLTASSVWGVLICMVLCFCSGLFGYLQFGDQVTDSVLLYYNPIKDHAMAVAYAGIILKLCVGFGMHMIPMRDSVYHVIKVDVKEVAWWKNALMCTFIATVALIAGLLIPNVTVVFGLVGGLCGGMIGYVFPSLMFMYSGNFTLKSVGWFHYIMTYLLLLVGVIGVVFGTGASVYSQVMS